MPVERAPRAQGGRPLRFLYLFAGGHRQSAVKDFLEAAVRASSGEPFAGVEASEIDVLRDPVEHDLLSPDRQEDFRKRVEDGEFDFVMVTPPCNTFSRARMANQAGPPVLRNRTYPWGFPWLRRAHRAKCEAANVLVAFSFSVLEAVVAAEARGYRVQAFLGHPEDLGAARRGVPASISQRDRLRKAVDAPGFFTVAIHQCKFGAMHAKPTRIVTNVAELGVGRAKGWPVFSAGCEYLGPSRGRAGTPMNPSWTAPQRPRRDCVKQRPTRAA